MTIDYYVKLSQEFFNAANKYDVTNKAVALRNILTNIKNLRANSNAAQQQQLTSFRNQVDVNRNNLVIALEQTRNDLFQNNNYNTFYDTFIGHEQLNLLRQLTNQSDQTNINLFNNVDLFLNKIQIWWTFSNANQSAINHLDFDYDKHVKIEEKDSLVIVFENKALIDELKGLQKASEDWYFIVHSFGRLVNETNTKAEVLSITRGSLLLKLAIIKIIINAITECSNKISEAVLNALKVKEKVLELRQLTNNISSAELDLVERKEALKIKSLTNDITIELLKKYQANQTEENLHEIETFTKKAVRKLVAFQSKGGKVKPKLISPTEEEDIQVKLSEKQNNEIGQLEKEISRLTDGKDTLLLDGTDDGDEDDETVLQDNE